MLVWKVKMMFKDKTEHFLFSYATQVTGQLSMLDLRAYRVKSEDTLRPL